MRKFTAHVLILLLLFTVPLFGIPVGADADSVSSASPAWTPDQPAKPPAPKPTPAKPVVQTPSATMAPMAGDDVHLVVAGDAMWKIAAKHNMTLAQLVALNPQIKNPSMIRIGEPVYLKAAAGMPAASAPMPSASSGTVKVYEGLGTKTVFRNGPGTDSEGVPVYSFNIAMARATFDSEGRILNVFIDGYEVATPNYDGASMPHFSGWPKQSGYNVADHVTEKVTGVSVNTPESAAAEVNGWVTKRQRGDSYAMNPANEWYKQMDYFQKFFVGKTVAELEAWFAKNTTTAGRPIKANTTNAADLAKYQALTEKEKAELADVVSGATMSIRDAHGDFLGAVAEAYKNRVEVVVPVK